MKKLLLVGLAALVLAAIPIKMQSPVMHQTDTTTQVTQQRSNDVSTTMPTNVALQSPITTADAQAEWVINGQVQWLIPFWYTLEEAVCTYMIAWCDY